ncbi:hypothetical protein [Lysobacter korlensis]|uniref:hypothetical protein n=1 Tax=Lysobacter korlensis TaxID=553636 RepID=UPI0036DC633F
MTRAERIALEKLRSRQREPDPTPIRPAKARAPRTRRHCGPSTPEERFERLALSELLLGVDCVTHAGDPGAWAADLELAPTVGHALSIEVAKLECPPTNERLTDRFGKLASGLPERFEKTFAHLKLHLAQIQPAQQAAFRRFTSEIRTLDRAGTWSPDAFGGLREALEGSRTRMDHVTPRRGTDGRLTLHWKDGDGVSFGLFWHWPVIGAVLHARVRHRVRRGQPLLQNADAKDPPD